MNVVLIVVAALLGIAALGSAVAKFTRNPRVVESMHSVGVTDQQIPLLGVLELLGAIGLLVGIWIMPVGVAAAVGLTLYFLGAVISHVRVKAPVSETVPAVILALLALVTAILEVMR